MKNLLLIILATALISAVASCSLIKKNKNREQSKSQSELHLKSDSSFASRKDTGSKKAVDTASVKKTEVGVKKEKVITEQEKVETEYANGAVTKVTTTKTKTTALKDSSGQKVLEAIGKKTVDSSGSSSITSANKKTGVDSKQSTQAKTVVKEKSQNSLSWLFWLLLLLAAAIILVRKYGVKLLKKWFIIPIVLFSTVSYGQADSNNVLKVSAVLSGGNCYVTTQNLQPCLITMEVNIPGQPNASFEIPSKESLTITYPLWMVLNGTLQLRTKTKCMQEANSSWVNIPIAGASVLPVKVISFTGAKAYKAIKLAYKVEVSGGDYFDVEKSTDGHSWKTITSLYSSFKETFQRDFTDHYPLPGTNLYRIRMFSGGRISYSPTVSVKMDETGSEYILRNIHGIAIRKGNLAEIDQELKRQPKGTYLVQNGSTTTKTGN